MAEDPLIKIIMDREVIDTISTLIAKLERLSYDDGRTGVFRTKWGRNLFAECMRHLKRDSTYLFDVEEWYRNIVSKNTTKTRRDIDASIYSQPIDTDWLSALLEQELEMVGGLDPKGSLNKGGFVRILHNVLDLEDQAQRKLLEFSKSERQYNLMGVNMARNVSGVPLIAPAPAPKPGGVDDLLNTTRKNRRT